jgi:hypothetical protein
MHSLYREYHYANLLVDEKSLSQRRFCLWCPLSPLWFPRDAVLHGHLRRQPRTWTTCAIDLVSRPRLADRATQEHRLERPAEKG